MKTNVTSDAELTVSVHERYSTPLYRYLMRRVRDPQVAQDLVQETYLRFVRLEHKDRVQAPQAYIFRIASNLVYELRARERRDVVTFNSRLADCAAELVADPDIADPSEHIEPKQQLQGMLASLPPLHAAIVVMKKRDGLSMQEISRSLEISIHTVKKYLFLAVTQIRMQRGTRNDLGVPIKQGIRFGTTRPHSGGRSSRNRLRTHVRGDLE